MENIPSISRHLKYKRRWTVGWTWLLTAILLAFLYHVAKTAIQNEIRYQVMGVAIATAEGIDPVDLAEIQKPEDISKESYKRVQAYISNISRFNSDVRYIYTMRKAPNSTNTALYEYIVDQGPEDDNGNGTLDRDEMSELPGQLYDASSFPEMIKGWQEPIADRETSPDPPYPDVLSGYAPIKNESGETVALVGVDIMARTVSQKMRALRWATLGTWIIFSYMMSVLISLYYRTRYLLTERERLIIELQEALINVKTLSGLLPICASCKKVRNDQGYWEQIEKYVSEKSNAEFSHGICPDCMRKVEAEEKK